MARFNNKTITSTALNKIRAVLVLCFNYLHKKFLFGIFSRIDEKFFKFLIVGFINTVFAYSIYSIFIFIGLKANLALLLQYIFGVIWNFKTTGVLVFKNSNNSLIFKFVLSYVLTFLINNFLLSILLKHFNGYLAQALLILPIAVLSFLIFKFWVFKK